jgi:hypothetical protein
MSVPLRRCLNCDALNPIAAKFCAECGADLGTGAAPARPKPPSFFEVLGTVWKVLMALLLIPFLLLLIYIGVQLLNETDQGDTAGGIIFSVVVLVGYIWFRRRSGVG